MEPLRALADHHCLLLLEDAAQAHGATYRGDMAGSLGHAAAFSFYPSKNLGALGDGGAICTDDEGLADRARQLRDLGRDADSAHRLRGYNERLDGLQAGFLRTKLAHLDEWTHARRAIAVEYRDRLADDVELLDEVAAVAVHVPRVSDPGQKPRPRQARAWSAESDCSGSLSAHPSRSACIAQSVPIMVCRHSEGLGQT